MIFDETYWQDRWNKGETGWDIGYPSKPLQEYIDQLKDKSIKILIPGCGNAYEAEYLLSKGFENTSVIDIAPQAINSLKQRIDPKYHNQIILGNFFDHQGSYDLILEQTFFCALDKSLRPRYVQKMAELLKPYGALVGLMFGVPMYHEHPPFGGAKDEYLSLFEPYFDIHIMEEAYNSIPPRRGSELFIKLKVKD